MDWKNVLLEQRFMDTYLHRCFNKIILKNIFQPMLN